MYEGNEAGFVNVDRSSADANFYLHNLKESVQLHHLLYFKTVCIWNKIEHRK